MKWLKELLALFEFIFSNRNDAAPAVTVPDIPPPNPPPQPPAPAPVPPKYDWSTPETARHSLRVVADEEGLTAEQKDDFSRTMHCESGYNIHCVHPNLYNGKVVSTDYSIFQINDHYHIGPGKDFPSVEYVMNNTTEVARWSARQFKAGNGHIWVCKSAGLSNKYTA